MRLIKEVDMKFLFQLTHLSEKVNNTKYPMKSKGLLLDSKIEASVVGFHVHVQG